MTQPCDLLELLLVDMRDLHVKVVYDMLALAASSALPHGGVSVRLTLADQVVTDVSDSGILDFWFVSNNPEWPFEKAIGFAGVEAGRTMFVSTDTHAREQAAAIGLLSTSPDIDFMEHMLP